MSRTSPVKFRVFRTEFLRNYSMNWTQIFKEKLTLSRPRGFPLTSKIVWRKTE